MFINCRHCNALVATDPVTDLPPERCPRCRGVVRAPPAAEAVAADAAPTPAEPLPAAPPPAPVPEPPSAPSGKEAAASPAPAPEPPAPAAEAPPAAALPADAPATPAAVEDAPATTDEAPAAGTTTAPPDIDADTPPSAPDPTITGSASDEVDTSQAEAPADADTGDTTSSAPSAAAAASPATSATDAAGATSPGFLAKAASVAAPARGLRRWATPAAIAALVLLLGLQVVIADRDRLAADAQWRPLAASVCGVFGCSLPPWREPGAFVLLAREVRPHPDVAGALRVRASFRNDARWAQAWPRLLLTLSDVDGRAVAARAFDAGEYLAAPDAAALLEPGQSADIALDILEPSAATVSYAFDFR